MSILPSQLRSATAGQLVPAAQRNLEKQSHDAQSMLANRLAARLGLEPGSLSGKNAGDYTPDKVADRLLGFIEQRLSREQAAGADPEKLQKLLDQARKGVEQGFAEARKILDGMGVLGGSIAADIDSTYQKIQDGLGALDTQFQAPDSPSPGVTGSQALASRSQFSARAETFDLQITTRDGDRLRISVAAASASWSNSSAGTDGNRLQLINQSGSLQIGGWQIELDGTLDEGEMKALKDLFGQVQSLADSFYSGDLKGAFDRALTLEMDGNQLASMSLRMTQSSLRQVSESYGSVAGQSGQAASALNDSLIDYARGLLDALRSADSLTGDAKGLLEQLLENGFASDTRLGDDQLERARILNQRLLSGLQPLLQAQQDD